MTELHALSKKIAEFKKLFNIFFYKSESPIASTTYSCKRYIAFRQVSSRLMT